MRWEEANRSLWPNSEVHEESLPAMPALLLVGVQNKNTTVAVALTIEFAKGSRISLKSDDVAENPTLRKYRLAISVTVRESLNVLQP